MKYYSYANLSNGITVIRDAAETNMFLIEGSEAAVLIDTGIGFVGLREVVGSITSLPVMVFLTHGHLDHAGGIHEFEKIYLSKEDRILLKSAWDIPARMQYAKGILTDECLTASDFSWSSKTPEIHEFCNGQQFPLGDRTITAVQIPGHTKGSYVFFDSLSKSLILGDSCNPLTFLFLEESTSIKEYLPSLQVLAEMADKADRLFCSHRYGNLNCELSKTCIGEVIECCKDILDGTDAGEVFEDEIVINNHSYHPYSARKLGPMNMRTDGKIGNVIYAKKGNEGIQQ